MTEMHFVSSSNVEAVGYDDVNRELHVRFLNGRTYAYYNVDEYVFLELKDAQSPGTYLNQNIIGQYQYSQI